MHNILTKKLGQMCDLYSRGGIFKSSGIFLKLFRHLVLHILDLNKSLKNDQSDSSILSCDHKFI